MEFSSHNRTLTITKKTGVIGIINVTPDSFVATSRAQTEAEIIARAHEYIEGGADILEIGGESTGPGSKDVSVSDECARVLPAVQILRQHFPQCWIAVDTYKADVASQAFAAGADLINDVTAGRGDDRMFSVVSEARCPFIVMYAKDLSARTTIADAHYVDVIATITSFLTERIDAAKKSGITQIIVDPGLGHFVSSDPAVSWEILTRLAELITLGPILVSPARKSFLAGPTQLPASLRLPATIAANCLASVNGASFIRTHDVRQTRQALDAVSSILR